MPKYTEYMVEGHYLYFTSECIVEAIHAHASDKKLTRYKSAKFWILENGDSLVADAGSLSKKQINGIQKYIKNNFTAMCEVWANFKGITPEKVEFLKKNQNK